MSDTSPSHGVESPPQDQVDASRMRRAIELARFGEGQVSPNPLVGAVVCQGEEIVGEGYHARFGSAHAEVAALAEAGSASRGATLYVNLEPCDHRGKTPPCTEAILAAGVRRVVIGCRDPHSEAAGGSRRLRAAGVEVAEGVEGEAARDLNAPFLWSELEGRPFVTLKLALSLDGGIAARPGTRTRVTGELAWKRVHRWRAAHDAVLVGLGTVRADDPQLTARGEARPRVPPVRVVLDPELGMSPGAALVRTAGEAPVWVFAAEGASSKRRAALEAAQVEVSMVPRTAPDRLDLRGVLEAMHGKGLRSVLVEGGGTLAAGLMDAGLADRLLLLYAPLLFGEDAQRGFAGVRPVPRGVWIPSPAETIGTDTLIRLDREAVRRRLAKEL